MTSGVAGEDGQNEFHARYALGQKLRLCGDLNFECVVKAVEFSLGREPTYCLKWRDRREFTEAWMTAEEIDAVAKLTE